jgi:predicted RNase H-like HicB family nuclease
MKKYIYPACFYLEDNGQYSVIFPDFGGATYGNDLQDAMDMAENYLGGTIVDYLDDKETLPHPSDIATIKADEYPNGFVTLISVDADTYRSQKSVKKTLTIPAWLDKEATARHINFSAVLQQALKDIID